MILFTNGMSNAKTAKSDKSDNNYLTKILHLAPAKLSGREVCASRSKGCTIACLNTAGRGRMTPIQEARVRRTLFWFEDRKGFKNQILTEISAFVKKCEKLGSFPAIRMNGTSDIVWETQFHELFTKFPQVTYYDYTKHLKRCLSNWAIPENYHLTFSRSENNDKKCRQVLDNGLWNVAVVFDGKDFPTSFWGYPTYSADNDDLRFLDPSGGHIGCLYAKGKGKKDTTGFVLPVLSF